MLDENETIFAEEQLRKSSADKSYSVASEPHLFNCNKCGSSMHYEVGSQHLSCTSCGFSEDIENNNFDLIEEFSLEQALKSIKLKPLEPPHTEVTCKACGATSTWQDYRLSGLCHYCSTPIAKIDTEKNRLHIEAIVPFAIDKKSALNLFGKWLGNRWFAPNVLKEMQGHNKQFEGVYVPHWTFDSLTQTSYTGLRGEHYIVYERHIRIVNGKKQMVEVPVTKTRWHRAAGKVRVMFDDVLVLASMLLPKTIVNKLRPWQLSEARPYTPEYTAGLTADYYQLDLDDAFHIAKQRMANDIDTAIRRDIGGDVQQIQSKNSHYQNSTYKLLMLPIWYSSFEYKGVMYQTVINGQSGRVVGQYPKSPVKIAAAIIIGIIVVVIAGYVFSEFQ